MVGQSSPSSSAKKLFSRRQKSGSKSNDVQFATNISEGLLVQCRKLQAMINEREQTIKDMQLEQESMKSKVSAMSQAEGKFVS